MSLGSTRERVRDQLQHFLQIKLGSLPEFQRFGTGERGLILFVNLQVSRESGGVIRFSVSQDGERRERGKRYHVVEERLNEGLSGTISSTRFTFVRSDRIERVHGTSSIRVDTSHYNVQLLQYQYVVKTEEEAREEREKD
jgi:hypothetical protein